jgi:hypothetical protein
MNFKPNGTVIRSGHSVELGDRAHRIKEKIKKGRGYLAIHGPYRTKYKEFFLRPF